MRSPGAAFDLRAALAHELDAAVEDLASVEANPKGVHRARVRLKHARALARIGHICAPGLAAVFNESARGVMRSLAKARELTALADTARVVAQDAGERSRAALLTVAQTLEAEREALAPLDLERLRAELKDLRSLALVWPDLSQRQLCKGAHRLEKSALRAFRLACDEPNPISRHQWRRREKDRSFAATILDRDWPGRRRRKRSEALGHVLGQERDARLLMERLRQEPHIAGDDDNAARARKALRRYSARLGRKADHLGSKLHR